jgi:hypothetical protein
VPIPARLANDGWWLSSPPALARTDAAFLIFNEGQIQMNGISDTATSLPILRNDTVLKLFVAAAMVGFADWLFYDHRLGVSVAIFLAVLAGLSLLTNPVQASQRQRLTAMVILFTGLAPIVEELSFLSAALDIAALAIAVPSLTNPFIETIGDRLRAARQILLGGPFRLLRDMSELRSRSLSLTQITVWIVPLALSALFMVLFSAANPLIENWFALIDLRALFARLNMWRVLFWTAILLAIWPFVSARWKRRKQREEASQGPSQETSQSTNAPPNVATDQNAIFGAPAILRSLILFNLLFAVETALDFVYLWGNVALPDGMTYAHYAHRGAYPLMLTALLAGAFVLAAMRPNGPAQRIPIIRTLVFVFVAQNVMLVISSILRLDLYVEVYSLTYWRVAAFVWMILVALGLVMIVIKIAFNLGNRWLVLANLATLTAVLYICAFVNFPLLIADYNVSHSKELSGKGVPLDFYYVTSLGPQSLPAIDRFLRHVQGPNRPDISMMDRNRNALVGRHWGEIGHWRAWSFRGWRLKQYLDGISTNLGASS